MALVKYSPLISEIVGSVHNVTFSRCRAGAFIRTKHQPRASHTPHQTYFRYIFSIVTLRWSATLSNVQRIAWNTLGANTWRYNRAGKPYHPSGYNLFIGLNVFLGYISQAYRNAAPAVADFAAPHFDYPILATDYLGFKDDTGWSEGKTGWVLFHQSPPVGQSITSYDGPYSDAKTRNVASFNAGAWVSVPITPAWITGRRYFYEIRVVDNLYRMSANYKCWANCPQAH